MLFSLLLRVILWLGHELRLNIIRVNETKPVVGIHKIQIQNISDKNIPRLVEPHFLRPVWCRKRIELAPCVPSYYLSSLIFLRLFISRGAQV